MMHVSIGGGSAIRALGWGLAMAALASCSSGRPTGYGLEENAITTRGGLIGDNGVFHDVLYNPESVALNSPGYIVGVDKGRHRAVANGMEYPTVEENSTRGLDGVKRRMNNDPKVHYVSHIVRNEGAPYGRGNCVLYTVYSQWGALKGPPAVGLPPSYADVNGPSTHKSADDPGIAIEAGGSPGALCEPGASWSVGRAETAQAGSLAVLGHFGGELKHVLQANDSAPYTHVLLVSMGWNTPQIEAVRNFNAIVAHIKSAAGTERFNPLIVGVTWSSVWSSSWLDPLVKVVSYPSKANDADEVGTTWLAALVEEVRGAAPKETKLVAMGHSFGARAMFSAVCGDSALPDVERRRKGEHPLRKWDVLIGWQPAFSAWRMVSSGSLDGFVYPQGCLDRADTIVITASEYDEAVTTAVWADMAGGLDQWKTICSPHGDSPLRNGDWHCIHRNGVSAQALKTVNERAEKFFQSGKINYVDASQIVFFNQPGTGGGAHSDIYRAVHGQLNWQAIRSDRDGPTAAGTARR